MVPLSSRQRDTESGLSINNQDISKETNGLNPKLTKKDSRSAFDLRNTGHLSPYTQMHSYYNYAVIS